MYVTGYGRPPFPGSEGARCPYSLGKGKIRKMRWSAVLAAPWSTDGMWWPWERHHQESCYSVGPSGQLWGKVSLISLASTPEHLNVEFCFVLFLKKTKSSLNKEKNIPPFKITLVLFLVKYQHWCSRGVDNSDPSGACLWLLILHFSLIGKGKWMASVYYAAQIQNIHNFILDRCESRSGKKLFLFLFFFFSFLPIIVVSCREAEWNEWMETFIFHCHYCEIISSFLWRVT